MRRNEELPQRVQGEKDVGTFADVLREQLFYAYQAAVNTFYSDRLTR